MNTQRFTVIAGMAALIIGTTPIVTAAPSSAPTPPAAKAEKKPAKAAKALPKEVVEAPKSTAKTPLTPEDISRSMVRENDLAVLRVIPVAPENTEATDIFGIPLFGEMVAPLNSDTVVAPAAADEGEDHVSLAMITAVLPVQVVAGNACMMRGYWLAEGDTMLVSMRNKKFLLKVLTVAPEGVTIGWDKGDETGLCKLAGGEDAWKPAENEAQPAWGIAANRQTTLDGTTLTTNGKPAKKPSTTKSGKGKK